MIQHSATLLPKKQNDYFALDYQRVPSQHVDRSNKPLKVISENIYK
jgi:hypothetical protein